MKIKIKAVSSHLKALRFMREERENYLKYKELSADGCIPRGLLHQGKSELKNHLGQFDLASDLDQ